MSAARGMNAPARHATFVASMWVLGLAALGAAAYAMTLPLDWQQKLVVWILLTFIADEAGNWFGYSAVPLGVIALGALPFLPTSSVPEQWWIIFPLIAGALLAALAVKHAGGPLVLPFAAALFALPIIAAARAAPFLDASMTFPANAQFQKLAFIAAGVGLLISLIRQVAATMVRAHANRPARTPRPEPVTRFERGSEKKSTAPLGTPPAEPVSDTVNAALIDRVYPQAPGKSSSTVPVVLTKSEPEKEKGKIS